MVVGITVGGRGSLVWGKFYVQREGSEARAVCPDWDF